MVIGHAPSELAPARIDVAAGTAFELLLALAGASVRAGAGVDPELADALEAVGDTAGESWLNLLGVAVDLGQPYDAARLVEAVAGMDAVELRRHLLGAYAWSWTHARGRGHDRGRRCEAIARRAGSCSPTSGTTAASRATRCRYCCRWTRRRRGHDWPMRWKSAVASW